MECQRCKMSVKQKNLVQAFPDLCDLNSQGQSTTLATRLHDRSRDKWWSFSGEGPESSQLLEHRAAAPQPCYKCGISGRASHRPHQNQHVSHSHGFRVDFNILKSLLERFSPSVQYIPTDQSPSGGPWEWSSQPGSQVVLTVLFVLMN